MPAKHVCADLIAFLLIQLPPSSLGSHRNLTHVTMPQRVSSRSTHSVRYHERTTSHSSSDSSQGSTDAFSPVSSRDNSPSCSSSDPGESRAQSVDEPGEGDWHFDVDKANYSIHPSQLRDSHDEYVPLRTPNGARDDEEYAQWVFIGQSGAVMLIAPQFRDKLIKGLNKIGKLVLKKSRHSRGLCRGSPSTSLHMLRKVLLRESSRPACILASLRLTFVRAHRHRVPRSPPAMVRPEAARRQAQP